jgi:hypothetical protein
MLDKNERFVIEETNLAAILLVLMFPSPISAGKCRTLCAGDAVTSRGVREVSLDGWRAALDRRGRAHQSRTEAAA